MIREEEALEKLKNLGFECQQCGNCCLMLGSELSLTIDEAKKWDEFDEEVFSNFGYYFPNQFMDIIPELRCADLWFHPETGEELRKCPFIRKQKNKYKCLIYNLRPYACKIFPIIKATGELGDWADICPEVKRITNS
jgi:Fe-S-cluster containining protein